MQLANPSLICLLFLSLVNPSLVRLLLLIRYYLLPPLMFISFFWSILVCQPWWCLFFLFDRLVVMLHKHCFMWCRSCSMRWSLPFDQSSSVVGLGDVPLFLLLISFCFLPMVMFISPFDLPNLMWLITLWCASPLIHPPISIV